MRYLPKEPSNNRYCWIPYPVSMKSLSNCRISCFQDIRVTKVVCCYEANIKCVILHKSLKIELTNMSLHDIMQKLDTDGYIGAVVSQ